MLIERLDGRLGDEHVQAARQAGLGDLVVRVLRVRVRVRVRARVRVRVRVLGLGLGSGLGFGLG